MGGDPIKSLNVLLDALFLALHEKRYEELSSLLLKIDDLLENADENELKRFYKAVEEIEKRIQQEQEVLIIQIQNLQDLKKFQF